MSRRQAFLDRVRATPATHRAWRVAVGVAGALVVALGLVLVPFPGPGWLVVLGGVGIWAVEFERARRLRRWGLGTLRGWTAWVGARALWVRGLLGLACAGAVAAVVLAGAWLVGPPAWLPDAVERPLGRLVPTR